MIIMVYVVRNVVNRHGEAEKVAPRCWFETSSKCSSMFLVPSLNRSDNSEQNILKILWKSIHVFFMLLTDTMKLKNVHQCDTPERPEKCLWWRLQRETFSALPAICAGNSPVTGECPAQRPVTRSFDVFFYLRLTKRLSKHGEAYDLRRHRTHNDVNVMFKTVYGAIPRISFKCHKYLFRGYRKYSRDSRHICGNKDVHQYTSVRSFW